MSKSFSGLKITIKKLLTIKFLFYLLNMKLKNPSNDYVEKTTAWAFLFLSH